jgi:hypothetical protein
MSTLPDKPKLRVLAEAITVAGKSYPRGTVTAAIPAGVVRWLVEGTEYEWVKEPPAPPAREFVETTTFRDLPDRTFVPLGPDPRAGADKEAS